MKKPHLAIILGIRPDVIRASIFLNKIRNDKRIKVTFIWSGQHYSKNLRDIFFKELKVKKPEIQLGAKGLNDADISADIIKKLYKVLYKIKPNAALFLGDTNTVLSSIAAAQLNIPIVHFEGLMRSYDWRMPEEKYRGIVDHLADIIYTYYPEYKRQGISEGINPKSIVVVGNPIVDILNKYYYNKKNFFKFAEKKYFLKNKHIQKKNYYLMTCHRRENVHDKKSLIAIIKLCKNSDKKIYFPASYRTQKVLKIMKIKLPKKLIMVDPVGYNEFLILMTNSAGVITDSGTVVEETCVLNIPSLQMRRSTERPQTYDCGSSVKYDPSNYEKYSFKKIFKKLNNLSSIKWKHNLGDGKSSHRIYKDLLKRLLNEKVYCHRRIDYHLNTKRSYRGDGLK